MSKPLVQQYPSTDNIGSVLPLGIFFLPQMNANERKLVGIGLPSSTAS